MQLVAGGFGAYVVMVSTYMCRPAIGWILEATTQQTQNLNVTFPESPLKGSHYGRILDILETLE